MGRTGFGALPNDLERAALDRHPVSLHWSARSNGLLLALPLAGLLIISYIGHWGFFWLIGVAVLLPIVGTRRIDLDESSLTVIPMLPVFPAQRFRFADVGPFAPKLIRRSPLEGLQSSICNGRSFRAANVWPRRKVSLTAAYGPSLWKKALTASEFIALIDAYRGAPATGFRET